jgi:glucose-6-phosphate isomerase
MTARDPFHRVLHHQGSGIWLDLADLGLDADFDEDSRDQAPGLVRGMAAIEAGATANPDEGRRVGHYWLRAPELAPDPETGAAIRETRARIRDFVSAVHAGRIAGPGGPFRRLLAIGIGGSALGPELLAQALAPEGPPLLPAFLDNTDPEGIGRTLRSLGEDLSRTLILVTSKSGSTPEPRNAWIHAARHCAARGLDAGRQAVAITQEGSVLDRQARKEGWLARFPMWDWVGGRTSLFSVVGLLPAALLGVDTEALLRGAADMDRWTRNPEPARNPALGLALALWRTVRGCGDRELVILPYKDRLALLSRYLQQLVMESLGKEKDLLGRVVEQGLTVYGNKGSTDQHAFVQQLRDGRDRAVVGFIEVLCDGDPAPVPVEDDVTAGDYLSGFLHGTRAALRSKGRPSFTLTLPALTPQALGALIALFERVVGFFALRAGINAYHQPGVEAGKAAAARLLRHQRDLLGVLREAREPLGLQDLAARAGCPPADAFVILRHLAANRPGLVHSEGSDPALWTWASRQPGDGGAGP